MNRADLILTNVNESKYNIPVESVIKIFTDRYKETKDDGSGGSCAEIAFIYTYLNSNFRVYGMYYPEDPEEGYCHFIVGANGKFYDGTGEIDEPDHYNEVKLVVGTSHFNTTYVGLNGRGSAYCSDTKGNPYNGPIWKYVLNKINKMNL